MRFFDYLRLFRQSCLRGRRPAPHRKHHICLELECLEGRVVPTILFGKPKAETVGAHPGTQVMQRVDVQLVFWGAKWDYKQFDPIWAAAVEIAGKTYTDKLAQYGVTGAIVLDLATVTDSSPPATFSDAGVKAMLQAKMKDGTLREPAGDVDDSGASRLLYFVIPQAGSTASTSDNLGLHSTGTFTDGADENANADGTSVEGTVADEDDSTNTYRYGWTINDGNMDTVTSTFSHELVEAATDPEGNGVQVQHAPTGSWNEIGDFDAEKYTYRLYGHLVQSYWSESDRRFVGPDNNKQTLDVDGAGKLTVTGDKIKDSLDDTLVVATDTHVDSSTHLSTTGMQVQLNGEWTTFGPGVIKSIEVDPGGGSNKVAVLATLPKVAVTVKSAGSDTVTLGNRATGVQDIKADVTVKNSPGHLTDLIVDDASDIKGRKVSVGVQNIKGLAPATIIYEPAGLKSLTVSASVFPNIFTFTDTPSNKSVDVATTLYLAGIGDTVNVHATTGPLILVEFFGHATVNVGNEGKVAGIKGSLTVATIPVPGQGVDLNVDDHNDRDPRKVTVSEKDITGLAPAAITYAGPNLKSLTILGGFGGNTFLVSDTPSSHQPGFVVLLKGGLGGDKFTVAATTSPLTIDGNGGANTVNLGSPDTGKLEALKGSVHAINTGGKTKLTVDDHGDATGRTVGVTETAVTGMPSAAITFTAAGISSLTVNGGTGADAFTVTPSTLVSVFINGNGPTTAGGDTLNLTDDTGADVVLGVSGAGKITFPKSKRKDIVFTGIAKVSVPKGKG